jgi:hypothetical protein
MISIPIFIRKTKLYRTIRQIYRLTNQAENPEFIYKKNYTIGIFTGSSPINLSPPGEIKNPVLTAADVTDAAAVYVADPFIMQKGATWYMFLEVLNKQSTKGDIAVATSDDGFCWKYKQIVLSEAFHLSYPYVFEWKDEYYMIPESVESDEIRLYKADDFPNKWSYVSTLIQGSYCDSSIIYYDRQWWLFAAKGNDYLYLFFADYLMGPWKEHPKNPIISGDPHIARPGGRLVNYGGKIVRFAQDDFPTYGLKVHAFEITKLSTEIYEENPIADSLLRPSGHGWNAGGMHHICPWQIGENQWIAAVDGWGKRVKGFPKKVSDK